MPRRARTPAHRFPTPRPPSRSGARGLRGVGSLCFCGAFLLPGARRSRSSGTDCGGRLGAARVPGRESGGRLSGNAKRGPLSGVRRGIAIRLSSCARTVIGDELHDLALSREHGGLVPPIRYRCPTTGVSQRPVPRQAGCFSPRTSAGLDGTQFAASAWKFQKWCRAVIQRKEQLQAANSGEARPLQSVARSGARRPALQCLGDA
jgi:hypothetical protein